MVHFTCSNTSSLSSMLTLFCAKPFYRSYSSLARVVKGVSTMTAWPSFLTHLLAAEIVSRNDITLSCLFRTPAWFLSLSMVWSSLTSFLRSTFRATLRSSSLRLSLFLIFCVSLLRHISSSCYNTLKSSDVRGCILRSISFLCFSSWSLSMVSFFSNFCLSCSYLLFLSSFTNLRANHPRTQHCMYNAFFSRLSAHFSESNYSPENCTFLSNLSSTYKSGLNICVPNSRDMVVVRVFSSQVWHSRSYRSLWMRFIWSVCAEAWY